MNVRVWIVSLALLTTACSTRIGPGHVGIKVNFSGTERGVSAYPVLTGRVWFNPYSETVLEWPTFMQTAQWSHSMDEGKPINEEITFTTGDRMAVAADISVSYSLDPEKVPAFYVKFRSEDMKAFTHGFFRNITRDAFDQVGGKYKVNDIIGDNAQFLTDVRKVAQDNVEPYGVKIEQLGFIGYPRPPASVTDSINETVKAAQNALMVQNQVAAAEAEGRKRVAAAQADARATLARADAEAEANRKIANSITPTLVDYLRSQKWDGKLPQVQGNATPFITLK